MCLFGDRIADVAPPSLHAIEDVSDALLKASPHLDYLNAAPEGILNQDLLKPFIHREPPTPLFVDAPTDPLVERDKHNELERPHGRSDSWQPLLNFEHRRVFMG